jgi:hypothetical protein
MLHLRRHGLIDGSALTAFGEPLDRVLDSWRFRTVAAATRAAV